MPHWLPPRWDARAATPSESAAARAAQVLASPALAAAAVRINFAYTLLDIVRARASDAADTVAQASAVTLAQQLRWFLDCHCAFVAYVVAHDADTDADLGLVPDNADPRWLQIVPGDQRLICERLLPGVQTLLGDLDIRYKRQIPAARGSLLADILAKALPQPSMTRTLRKMLRDRCADELVMRTLASAVLCSLLGTYRAAALDAYNLQAQVALWTSFGRATRASLVDFLAADRTKALVIYACREYLVYAFDDRPAFAALACKTYDWPRYCAATAEHMRSVRAFLVQEAPRCVAGPDAAALWAAIDDYLAVRLADHTHDTRIIKIPHASFAPLVASYARRLRKAWPWYAGDVARVSSAVWQRAARAVANAGPGAGLSLAMLECVGVSPRGAVVFAGLVAEYNAGAIFKWTHVARMPPGDLEALHALISAARAYAAVAVTLLPPHIAAQQRAAIRRRLDVPPHAPLPAVAARVWFCPACRALRHVAPRAQDKHAAKQVAANGPDDVAYDAHAGGAYCDARRARVRARCGTRLIPLHMVGKLLHIDRGTCALCTGCGLLAHDARAAGPLCSVCTASAPVPPPAAIAAAAAHAAAHVAASRATNARRPPLAPPGVFAAIAARAAARADALRKSRPRAC